VFASHFLRWFFGNPSRAPEGFPKPTQRIPEEKAEKTTIRTGTVPEPCAWGEPGTGSQKKPENKKSL
jgi:hypothetical protein